MLKATSATSGGVVLDWTAGHTGPPEPCVFGDGPAICRSPGRGVPCHKRCAEAWITANATTPEHLAQLVRDHTPKRGAV